jgi:glucokinase
VIACDDLVLAVDCGGTKVEAALVDAAGVVRAASRSRQPTGSVRSADELARQVWSVVQKSLSCMPNGAGLRGIGIGSAGPIDLDRGSVSPVNLPGWQNFELRSLVEAASAEAGYPGEAVLRLDGQCIALAENWIGAAANRETVLGMIVSTGIGGGIIASGRIVTGATGNAGHIGQIEVAGFTTENGGCTLEEIASGPSAVGWARSQGWRGETGEDLALAYAHADAVAIRAVQRSASAIGRALASVGTLLDLDVVVIGGGFSQVTPDLFPLIRQSLASHALFEYVRKLEVLPTGLDSLGPLVGAAALVWTGACQTTPPTEEK